MNLRNHMAADEESPITVLVVEDDQHLRTLYERYLDQEYTVRTATTGEEALALMSDEIDVILLDRRLPDQEGETVLANLRQAGYETPVAMITGVEPDEAIIDMAFDEYMTKPVDRAAVVQTVKVLANRSLFEKRSREFFRNAAKVASIHGEGGGSVDADVIESIADLEETLADTIDELSFNGAGVVERNQPTETEIIALLEEIHEHSLPPTIRAFVTDYQSLADARPPFMWKWVHQLAPRNSLPCVPTDARSQTAGLKTLLILFITILDDVLEKRHDRSTFTNVARIPFNGLQQQSSDTADAETVAFATRLWEAIEADLRETPEYATYEELFRFDLKQAITAIEYSELVSENPDVATVADLDRYESHNMVMLAYADIDLMHSHEDYRPELGMLREAIMTAQTMARIGNWVSTWERELREGDFSAGPIIYSLEHGIISLELLQDAKTDDEAAENAIATITEAGVEKHFLNRWERSYHELIELNNAMDLMDLSEFISGTEAVLRYHLASRGLK